MLSIDSAPNENSPISTKSAIEWMWCTAVVIMTTTGQTSAQTAPPSMLSDSSVPHHPMYIQLNSLIDKNYTFKCRNTADTIIFIADNYSFCIKNAVKNI